MAPNTMSLVVQVEVTPVIKLENLETPITVAFAILLPAMADVCHCSKSYFLMSVFTTALTALIA